MMRQPTLDVLILTDVEPTVNLRFEYVGVIGDSGEYRIRTDDFHAASVTL